MSKIKVLTVDDSVLMNRLLRSALAIDNEIELVAQAYEANEARKCIKQFAPDIITLDVEMPGMNGLEFLERLMNVRPMPVIMFSSHTAEGTEITLRALELGAVDFLQKPNCGIEKAIIYLQECLVPKIKEAVKSKPRSLRDTLSAMRKEAGDGETVKVKNAITIDECDIIAIGASTGGVTAIREVLEHLPNNLPPIIITQHMPAGYTDRFADRLAKSCAIQVKELSDGETLLSGHAYIAPGTHHMIVSKRGKDYYANLNDGPAVSGHKPSVDVMFESVAKIAGNKAIGVILTGMGRDGASGLLKMKEAGALTFGQDTKTCVVYGMPKVAFEIGAVQKQLPLDEISANILAAFKTQVKKVS